MKFRHSIAFGRRIEFWVIGEMMKEGLDVHIPLVDDMGIDAIVRKEDGSFIEAQIKARSKNVILTEIQRALVYGHRESWGDAYHFHQFPVRNVSSKKQIWRQSLWATLFVVWQIWQCNQSNFNGGGHCSLLGLRW